MQSVKEYQVLLSAVSHEVRNPVTLINSYLQLLSKNHPEVCDYPYWSDIQSEMEHLKNLLQDISRYQNGFRLHKTPTDLNAWFSDYEKTLAPLLAQFPYVSFSCRTEPDLPLFSLDADRLRQILDNLVRNALEAIQYDRLHAQKSIPQKSAPTQASGKICPPKQINYHLTIQTTFLPDTPAFLRILVTDNGCGIDPEDMDTLFEPFTTHKPDGTGLGLAICRQIAEAHGGSITCVSPRQPTKFQLLLPAENRR